MSTPHLLKIAFAIPSARPDVARVTFREWQKLGYLPAVVLDPKTSTPAQALALANEGVSVTTVQEYKGWAAAVNLLCQEILPDVDIVVTGGEDQFPDPRYTALTYAEQFLQRFPDLCGIMQPTGDPFGSKAAAVSPWIGRGWIKRAYKGNGPLCSTYRHFFADEELAEVAKLEKVYWERSDMVQEHRHWQRPGHRTRRPVHMQAAHAAEGKDRILFNERKAKGFPGHELISIAPTSGSSL